MITFKTYFHYLFPKICRLLVAPVLLGATLYVLTTEEFGRYSFWLAVFSLLIPISTLGIKDYLISKISKQKSQFSLDIYISSISYLILFYLSIGFVTFLILDNDLNIIFKFILVYSLIGNLAIVGQASLEADEKSYLNSKILTITIVISAIMRLLFLASENTELIIFSHAFEPIIFLFLMCRFNNRFNISLKNLFSYSWLHIVGFAKVTLPLISTTFLVNIYMRADQIMIGKIMDYAALGKFSVAVRLVEISYVLGVAYSASIFPKMSTIFHSCKPSDYFKNLKKVFMQVILFSVCICVFYVFLAGFIVKIFLGTIDLETLGVLKLYCFSVFSVFIGTILSKHLILTKRYKVIFFSALIGAVLNLFLNSLLIPKFGIFGAAYGTLLAMGSTILIPSVFTLKDMLCNDDQ